MNNTEFAEIFLAKNAETWTSRLNERKQLRPNWPEVATKVPIPVEIQRNPEPYAAIIGAMMNAAAVSGGLIAVELTTDFWTEYYQTEHEKERKELEGLRRRNAYLERLVLQANLGKLRDYDPEIDSVPQSPESSLPFDEEADEEQD